MNFISRHLDDFLLTAGAGLVVYGLSILSIAAAIIAAGVMLIALGVLVGMGGSE